MGKLHDLGKYSEPFDRRLHGGPSVDHATAGAKLQKCLLYSEFQSIAVVISLWLDNLINELKGKNNGK